MLGRVVVAVCLLARLVAAAASGSVLVVLAPDADPASYSLVLNQLSADLGLTVSVKASTAATPVLSTDSFSHAVLLAPPSKALAADLHPAQLASFLDNGGNLVLAFTPSISELWRDFAREFDVEWDDRETVITDHFGFVAALDGDARTHTALAVPTTQANPIVFAEKGELSGPIYFRGIGHKLSSANPHCLPLLSASPTSYSTDTSASTETPFLSGSSMNLVSGFQARNGARVAWAGSTELFADAFWLAEGSGNKEAVGELLKWTLGLKNVVTVEGAELVRAADGESLTSYRTKDDLTYTLRLSPSSSSFPSSDLQFSFTMLDPHLLLPLPSSTTHGPNVFSTTFRLPDRHGVFTLKVDHRRPGWSWVQHQMTVVVTPPRHDEYERWIVGAAPWYASAGSVATATTGLVIGWFLLK